MNNYNAAGDNSLYVRLMLAKVFASLPNIFKVVDYDDSDREDVDRWPC